MPDTIRSTGAGHAVLVDATRFETKLGIRYCLRCGWPIEDIATGEPGQRAALQCNPPRIALRGNANDDCE